MQDKPDSLHTLGLDFSFGCLRAVQLSQRKGKPYVEKLYEIPISSDRSEPSMSAEEDRSDEAAAAEQIPDEFMKIARKCLVTSALPTGATLVRQLEIKLKKVSDIDAVLSFQAEPTLPYPIENGCLDRIL